LVVARVRHRFITHLINPTAFVLVEEQID
jgi:hypothetical protein